MALVLAGILAAGGLIQRPDGQGARPEEPTVAAGHPGDTRPAVRFEAIDVFIDSGKTPLAAYQFELVAQRPADRGAGGSEAAGTGRSGFDSGSPLSTRKAGRMPAPLRHGRYGGPSLQQARNPWTGSGAGPESPITAPNDAEGLPTSPERKRGVGGEATASRPAASNVKIVGVEGGEHPAFREPPYYDPAALSRNRIIIAAFNTGRNLPTGKTRVARLHLQITGPEPEYRTELIVAASSAGKDIPATITVETGVTQ